MNDQEKHYIIGLFKALWQARYDGHFGCLGCGAMDRKANRIMSMIRDEGCSVWYSEDPKNDGHHICVINDPNIPEYSQLRPDQIVCTDTELGLDFTWDDEWGKELWPDEYHHNNPLEK